MAAVEMLEKGSLQNGPASGCARNCGTCPMARFCKAQTVEFGKNTLNVNSLTEVPANFQGKIAFNSVSQGSGEFPITPIRTSEKICSECNEPASTCVHSKISKN